MSGPKLRCLICNDEIQSMSVHDFKWCQCGNVFIDGGGCYTRYGGVGLEDNSFEFIKERRDEDTDT